MRTLSRKQIIVGVALVIPTLILISLVKLLAYEAQSKTGLLRESVGGQVVLSDKPSWPVEGTLVLVRYRPNDTIGFFDLEVTVRGREGGMTTGLEPWTHSKVKIVGK